MATLTVTHTYTYVSLKNARVDPGIYAFELLSNNICIFGLRYINHTHKNSNTITKPLLIAKTNPTYLRCLGQEESFLIEYAADFKAIYIFRIWTFLYILWHT